MAASRLGRTTRSGPSRLTEQGESRGVEERGPEQNEEKCELWNAVSGWHSAVAHLPQTR